MFHNLFFAVTVQFPPLLSPLKGKTSFLGITYETHMDFIWENAAVLPRNNTSGLLVSVFDMVLQHTGENVFKCSAGAYISSSNVCNNITDCPSDNSDENNYICEIFAKKLGGIWNLGSVTSVAKRTTNSTDQVKQTSFLCKSNTSIDFSMVNDLAADCGGQQDDEPVLVTMFTIGKHFSCANPNQIPCMAGHSHCYHISQICVFTINTKGHLVPCRNGAHLDLCNDIQCNAKFKCYLSYCIQWTYVCDGKWDCPKGNDEGYGPVCGTELPCVNLFRCQIYLHKCVSLSNVCDGIIDCPLGDDESLCNLTMVQCPVECMCMVMAILCDKISSKYSLQQLPFSVVVLENSALLSVDLVSFTLPNSTLVRIRNAKNVVVCHLALPTNLTSFHINFCVLNHIRKFCFSNIKSLVVWDLSQNNVELIDSLSFVNLSTLEVLNLSMNPFSIIPKQLITNAPSFQVLSLKNTKLSFVHDKAFVNLFLHQVETESYQLCCLVPPGTHCESEPPWYISCSDLLPGEHLSILFGATCCCVFVFNTLSFLLHVHQFRLTRKSFAIIVMLINCSDILCAVYLGIIWGADMFLKGRFFVYEEIWKSSIPCFAAFYVLNLFLVLTQTSLFLLTFSRYSVVTNLVTQRFTLADTKSLEKLIGYVICVSSVLAFALTIAQKFSEEVIPTSLCLPYLDPTHSHEISFVITWLFSVSQIVTSILILSLNILLVLFVKNHQREMKHIKTTTESFKGMFFQLALVTSSNVLCWFPTGILFISATFLQEYPIDLVIWATVCGTPINSIMNPFVCICVAAKYYVSHKKASLAHWHRQTVIELHKI